MATPSEHRLRAVAVATVLGVVSWARAADYEYFEFLSPPVSLALPPDTSIPAGRAGEAVRRGRALFTDTRRQLPAFVGNALTCSNCHLGAGSVAYAAPMIGLWGLFPEYRARAGRMISLAERVNQCFERSMNGTALASDGPEMKAIEAYVRWASQGQPAGHSIAGRGFGALRAEDRADAARGARIYAARCSACHGIDGDGRQAGDGRYAVPPVWGANSFNLGAGMARTSIAAAFIRYNMPPGAAGTLSDQEAIDVAQFVTHQPRPDFAPRRLDWPRGDAPRDARLD